MSVSQPKESQNDPPNTEINPEQALGLVSLGLMQKLYDKGITDLNWLKDDERCDFHELRQRLELTSLAIETGAPLSTSEVSKLLGVRPGASKVNISDNSQNMCGSLESIFKKTSFFLDIVKSMKYILN